MPFISHNQKEKLEEVWCLLELLLQIMQILYSYEYEEIDIQRLSRLIKEYLSMLVSRGVKLTPKHHNLLHYAHAIRKMGPLRHMWVMRMEAKHKEFTDHAKTLNCFKNVTYSLSKLHEQIASLNKYEYKTEIKKSQHLSPENSENMELYKRLGVFKDGFPALTCILLEFLEIDSFKYRKGLVLWRENATYVIEDILIDDGKYFVICSCYEIIGFCRALNSIEIKKIENKFEEIDITPDRQMETHQKYILNDKIFVIADSLKFYKCYQDTL